MNGKQNPARFDVSFVSLRFVLRDAHPNQCANQAAHRAAHAESRQSGHDRTGRNERTDSGNCKDPDSGQQSKSSANHSAGGNSGGGSFGRFCTLVVSKVFSAPDVREQDRNIVVREPRGQ